MFSRLIAAPRLSRRAVTLGFAAVSFWTVGCSGEPRTGASEQSAFSPSKRASVSSPAQAVSMTVHKDPNCGCCTAWANQAVQAGFQVSVVEQSNMAPVKSRLGVPDALGSCHTTEVGGYVIEGHVPFEHVRRLLTERPAGIRGIAVPGMPAGSPGMEVPGVPPQPFEVFAFDGGGKTSLFASVR